MVGGRWTSSVLVSSWRHGQSRDMEQVSFCSTMTRTTAVIGARASRQTRLCPVCIASSVYRLVITHDGQKRRSMAPGNEHDQCGAVSRRSVDQHARIASALPILTDRHMILFIYLAVQPFRCTAWLYIQSAEHSSGRLLIKGFHEDLPRVFTASRRPCLPRLQLSTDRVQTAISGQSHLTVQFRGY